MFRDEKKPASLRDRISGQVLEVLGGVTDPDCGQDIVALEMVSGVQVSQAGDVVFVIEVDPARGAALEPLRQEAEQVVSAIPGVGKVSAILTAQKPAPAAHNDPHGMGKNPPLTLPVRHIIAVASGKGGVGKSTVATGLARAIAQEDGSLRVGILDADIYGPSQVLLNRLEGVKPEFSGDEKIIPPVVPVEGNLHGLKVMSIGFMVDTDKALIWRGPMVQSAIYQLFRDVQWAEEPDGMLDVLIVDMPPGTGDAQLTLAQKVPVSGAVIVSTPQDLALADARRAVEMFRKTGVPVIGLIENMSTHICSVCGHEEPIFGHGGAREEAGRLGIPFLGDIPLSMDIRVRSDSGQGFVLDEGIAVPILKFLT